MVTMTTTVQPSRQIESSLVDALRASSKLYHRLEAQGAVYIDELPASTVSPRNQFGDRRLFGDFEAEESVIETLNLLPFKFLVFSEEHGRCYAGRMSGPTDFVAVLDGMDGSSRYRAHWVDGPSERHRFGTMLAFFRCGPDENPSYADAVTAGIMEHSSGSLFLATENNGAHVVGIGDSVGRPISTATFDTASVDSLPMYVDSFWDFTKRFWVERLNARSIPFADLSATCAHHIDVLTGKAGASLECSRKWNLELAVTYRLIREAGGGIFSVEGSGADRPTLVPIDKMRYLEFHHADPEDRHPILVAANRGTAERLLDRIFR